MKIRLLFSITILVVLIGCMNDALSGDPKPEFSSKEFEFGRIPRGVIVPHIFYLKNMGGDSLVISKVRSHCGCTSIPVIDSIVYSGDSVAIELQFRSSGYRGSTKKSASVNIIADTMETLERIYFHTYVDTNSTPFTYGELATNIGSVKFDTKTESQEIALFSRVAAERNIRVVNYQSERIELSWTETKIAPKDTVILQITRLLPPEQLIASVTLEMEGFQNTRITLPVLGENYKQPVKRSVRPAQQRWKK